MFDNISNEMRKHLFNIGSNQKNVLKSINSSQKNILNSTNGSSQKNVLNSTNGSSQKNVLNSANSRYSNLGFPTDFNPEIYKKINKNLSHLSDAQASIHYLRSGRYQKKIYKNDLPKDFDPATYKNLHKDLIHMTDKEATYHYLHHGIFDNRRYKPKENIFNEKSKLLCPTLFGQYHQTNSIDYNVIKFVSFDRNLKNICHLHISNINEFDKYYGDYIDNIVSYFNVILTYSHGLIQVNKYNFTIVDIKNKDFSTVAKICVIDLCIKYDLLYESIMFLTPEYNLTDTKCSFESLAKNKNRLKIIMCLLEMKNNNLWGIFPSKITNKDTDPDRKIFCEEILKIITADTTLNRFQDCSCMVLNKTIINFVFTDRLNYFYDCFYRNEASSVNAGFEMIWINIIKHLSGTFIFLSPNNIMDNLNIKINALYFPQFHETEENNLFWGKGFTEWTFLKPFMDNYEINEIKTQTLKPHPDIGYYDLNSIDVLNKQINIASTYGINGFVIYHYWFNTHKKVLYKPLEYFLDDQITFPFCISWANETWTRRWDGGNHEVLLKQEYGTKIDWLQHIQYLIKFFLRPNYIRNSLDECLMYIYKFSEIGNIYDNMMIIWRTELDKFNLKIKIIITENSFIENSSEKYKSFDKFLFEPMYSCARIPLNTARYDKTVLRQKFNFDTYSKNNPDVVKYFDHNENAIFEHSVKNYVSIDYEKIIKNYIDNGCECDNKHLGLPLYWNNYVRQKNNMHLFVQNFSFESLERMLMILICKIILSNISSMNNLSENIIIVNAWNEWNEQAVLEPNTITGYQTLETIHSVIKDC
jgi:hypothetical protein